MGVKMIRFISLFLILCCMTAPSPSFAKGKTADKPQPSKAPTSTARPVYEPDGSFGFCLTDIKYPDKKKLTIAYSPTKQINLGLTIPEGKFKPGARYDLTVSLDKGSARKVRAETLDEETLLLQMGSNVSFRNKLTEAKLLDIGSPSNTVSFELSDIAKRIKDLEICIATKAATKDEKAAKAAQMMPSPLKAILLTAGFENIVPLSLESIPVDQRPADYMWKTGDLLSGVRERAMPEGKSLSDMVGLHMQGLKKHCPGHFNGQIGREKVTNALTLRTAQALCAPKETGSNEQTVGVSLLFYVTKAGAFTVFTFEGSEAQQSEANTARDRLASALLSLADTQ